jgi:hypothetical protein
MKLSQLAAKPQLVKVILDDEEVINTHGEAIEFWTWDRQPLDVFMKLAQLQERDMGKIITIIRALILDEEGREIIAEEAMLPTDILIKVVAKVVSILGKSSMGS